MKINQIRDVLSFAAFCCSDLNGYTRSELLRYDVPTHLGKQIEALEALDIAPALFGMASAVRNSLSVVTQPSGDGANFTTRTFSQALCRRPFFSSLTISPFRTLET